MKKILSILAALLAFATPALADGEAAATAGGGTMGMIIYFVIIIAVFYFLLIRPQKKKEKEAKAMIESIKKGDKIVTIGGFQGKVLSVKNGVITRTVPREQLIHIQTPQIFYRKEYLELAKKAQESGVAFTDDASIYEFFNKPVRFVEGHRDNLKITVPEDAAMIKTLMEEQLCE